MSGLGAPEGDLFINAKRKDL
jgi:hypothetical protein